MYGKSKRQACNQAETAALDIIAHQIVSKLNANAIRRH